MNANSVDALTTNLATGLARKRRCAEATYAAQAERVPGSDSETETEEEDSNHTGTGSLRYSALPKKDKQNEIQASDICLVLGGEVNVDTVLNVMHGIIYAKDKKWKVYIISVQQEQRRRQQRSPSR